MSSVIEDTQPSGSASLSLLQRISYGSLDVAGDFLYFFGLTYILFFYIDVVGISLAVASVFLPLPRLYGGDNTPIL
ncbi:MFS transporter, partial [Salmonella enterica subsp. enterica serovar Heidelberg]